METNDRASDLWLELKGWAKWNVFLCGILFLSGWAMGIYRTNIAFYQTVSADDVIQWEMEKSENSVSSKVRAK